MSRTTKVTYVGEFFGKKGRAYIDPKIRNGECVTKVEADPKKIEEYHKTAEWKNLQKFLAARAARIERRKIPVSSKKDLV